MKKKIQTISTFKKVDELCPNKISVVEFGFNNETCMYYTCYKYPTMKAMKFHVSVDRSFCELFYYKIVNFLLL